MTLLKKHIWLVLPVLVAVVLIALNYVSYLYFSKIGTDAVSWFLPAKFLTNGTGVPYTDFWDTKPTGLINFSTLWLLIFGESTDAFRLLHLLLISIPVFGMMRIYYHVFPRVLFNILYILSLLVFMSFRIQTQPLLIELFGLSFAIIAINILITEKWSPYKRAFFASLFFTLGGQMKESYALHVLSMIPFIVYTAIYHRGQLKRTILYSVLGVVTVVSVLVMTLFLTNTVSSYAEVIRFIMEYNTPTTIEQAIEFPKASFVYLQYPLRLLLLMSLIAYLFSKYFLGEISFISSSNNKITNLSLNLKINRNRYIPAVAFFYAIGAWAGFTMQNKFGNHYDAQMVFPVMLLITIPLYILSESVKKNIKNSNTKRLVSLIFALLIIVLMFPKKDYFIEHPLPILHPHNINQFLMLGNNPDMTIENAIMSKTAPDDCIIHVYGWGVGTTYFYANRKPCSRFFLVNLLPSNFYHEYKTTLTNNPPVAIVYTLGGADIDNIRFESEVFDFRRVIDNCYQKDTEVKDLYFSKIKGEDLKSCVEKNS